MGRFVPSSSMERDLAFGAGMQEFLADRAEAGAKAAEKAAPRYKRPNAVEYKKTLVSGVRPTRHGFVGFIGSEDPFWHLPEFGGRYTRASAPLRNGLEAVASRTRRTPR